MKTVETKVTTLELIKLTGQLSDEGKFADTCDLIIATLDNIPQGGFTPKDIRDRNRIQESIDSYRKGYDKDKIGKPPTRGLQLEDHDYENLKSIVASSRWASRNKVLQDFLDSFNLKD